MLPKMNALTGVRSSCRWRGCLTHTVSLLLEDLHHYMYHASMLLVRALTERSVLDIQICTLERGASSGWATVLPISWLGL